MVISRGVMRDDNRVKPVYIAICALGRTPASQQHGEYL